MRKLTKRTMYAVSGNGKGIIGGTLGYTRKEAILHFQGGGFIKREWEDSKRDGYRTVKAMVKYMQAIPGHHF